MDPQRFDVIARSLAAPKSRRGLLGALAALAAGLAGARGGAAQVTQAYCGNVVCARDPGRCKPGCVCCVYGNGNSRCRPPGECTGTVVSPATTTTPAPATTTTTAPTTTTTTSTTTSTTTAAATTTTAAPTTTTVAPTTTTAAPTTTTTAAPTTTTTTTQAPATTTTTTPLPCIVVDGVCRCRTDEQCDPGSVCYYKENPFGGTCAPESECASHDECDPGFLCQVVEVEGVPQGVCKEPLAGVVMDAPVAAVWQALTDAPTLTALGIPTDIAPRVGHRFRFSPLLGSARAEPIEAEMTAVDPLRSFTFRWLNSPNAEPTVVTMAFDPVGDGSKTRLRLTHTDATGKSCVASARVLGPYWGPRLFRDTLPRHLAR